MAGVALSKIVQIRMFGHHWFEDAHLNLADDQADLFVQPTELRFIAATLRLIKC